MKFRNLLFTVLCGLTIVAGFASCSTDDDNDAWREGAKIQLPEYRAFVLSEGLMNKNNSHLFFVDPMQDTIYNNDIYEAQNGQKIGDTAQGMVVYDGDIYYVANVSNYIARLNGSAVEQKRFAFTKKLGNPRYLVVDEGKVYVTTWGGYVCRFDAKSLVFEDSVKIGTTLEKIIEKDDRLYVVETKTGNHSLYILNEKDLKQYETVEIMDNPTGIYESDGHFYITAFDASYISYVSSYNPQTKKCKRIGNAAAVLPVGSNLYIANSETDWNTYKTTTTFARYNATTEKTEPFFSKVPAELGSIAVYMLARNPYDGTFYIGTNDYVNNSRIYHFGQDGTYLGKTFSAGGIGSNSMIFLR